LTGYQGILDGREYKITANGADLSISAIMFWRLNNATIKNVVFNFTFAGSVNNRSGGLCRQFVESTLQNVTINANFENQGYAGAIVGTFFGGVIENCQVNVKTPAYSTSLDGISAVAAEVDLGDWSDADSIIKNVVVHLPSNVGQDAMALVARVCANDQDITDENKKNNLIEEGNSIVCDLAEADIFTWETSKVQISDAVKSTEVAPQGYTTVYENCFETAAENDAWNYGSLFSGTASGIKKFRAVKFAIKTTSTTHTAMLGSSYVEIRGISNEWSEIIIRLNANGNWDISKNGEVVKNNVTAEALYEIFAWRGSSEVGVGLTLLVTDVQCITWTKENQNVKVFGEKVKDVITVDAATALDVVTNGIPGFEKVYAVKISSDGGKRLTSDVEVAKYEELRFAIRTVDGTLFMCMADAIDWNATTFGGQGGDVLYFALTQGDEGVWTVVMTNGDVSVEKTIFNVTTLQDFFWFNVHGYEIEVSELRGVEKAVEPWGVKVSDSAFGNTTVSSEKAPAGYQNVYEREVTVPGGRVDYSSPMGSVVITGYSELRFMVKSSKADVPFSMGSGSVDIYNWSFGTEWLEMKLVQNADGTWNVYRGETEFATNVSLANGNIQDVFAWLFAWDGASEGKVATIYSTELRGVEKAVEPWGVKVSDSAFGNTTVSLEKTPAGYQNVYEREYTVPGGRIDYGSALASADIRNYEKVVFAVKGTNANTTIILGSGAINIYDGGNGFTTEWVEFILTQNADGTWNVNMGEKVLATNVALTNGNIQEIFPWVYCWNSEGENQTTTFYVTELRGVEKVLE
jgi:hypothetical protein